MQYHPAVAQIVVSSSAWSTCGTNESETLAVRFLAIENYKTQMSHVQNT